MYYRVGLPLPHHFKPSLSRVRIVQDFDSTHLLGIVQKMPLGCCLQNNIEVKKGFVKITDFPSITKPLTNGTYLASQPGLES
jgi:hypothetical protein